MKRFEFKRNEGRLNGYVRVGLVLAGLAACGKSTPPPQPIAPVPEESIITPSNAVTELDSKLRSRIAQLDSGEVAVSLVDLETGIRLGINEHLAMHAASTMKVPVMLEVFRQAEQQRLRLTDSIPIVNEFTSIADRSRFSLSRNDDADSTLYRRVGGKETVRELARLMIVRSSNLATNILLERVRPPVINETLARIGASGMNVLRGVEDGPAFQRGLNNTTTADGFARALEALARCRLTSRAACDEMVDILAAQEFNDMIPAGLPAGTRVAHKTGWITTARHDGGIVYPRGRAAYVLVVLTRGIPDTLLAARVVADISRTVWDELSKPNFALPNLTATARNLLETHRRFRNPALGERRFTQTELLAALDPHTGRGIQREEVGRSAGGRPLYLYRFGSGSTHVLLWSQMHGNEPTATMALADLAFYLNKSGASRVQDWATRLTIAFLPMLNPDGAERFQRHNNNGIDIHRDARALVTLEGRTLKAVHDRFRPHFAFNLHDQSPRVRVGDTDRLAAISLLAPAKTETRIDDEQTLDAKRLAATIRRAVAPFVGGHIARYDDTFNPRAFGDLMQSWGARTVMIETGGWRGDDEKQYLRSVNFVALLSALDAIADESYHTTPLELYETLPANGRSDGVRDLLISGGQIVVPGLTPYRADIVADFQDGSSNGDASPTIVEIGDLQGIDARDTIPVNGRYLHPAASAYRQTPGSRGRYMAPGTTAEFTVSDSPDPYDLAAGFIRQGRYREAARNELVPAESRPSLVTCYQVELGEWPEATRSQTVAPELDWTRPPQRIELLWRYAPDRNPGRSLLVKPLNPPSNPFRTQTWERLAGDSVSITWSTGAAGMTLALAREVGGFRGTARLFSDEVAEGKRDPETSANLRRIACATN